MTRKAAARRRYGEEVIAVGYFGVRRENRLRVRDTDRASAPCGATPPTRPSGRALDEPALRGTTRSSSDGTAGCHQTGAFPVGRWRNSRSWREWLRVCAHSEEVR